MLQEFAGYVVDAMGDWGFLKLLCWNFRWSHCIHGCSARRRQESSEQMAGISRLLSRDWFVIISTKMIMQCCAPACLPDVRIELPVCFVLRRHRLGSPVGILRAIDLSLDDIVAVGVSFPYDNRRPPRDKLRWLRTTANHNCPQWLSRGCFLYAGNVNSMWEDHVGRGGIYDIHLQLCVAVLQARRVG